MRLIWKLTGVDKVVLKVSLNLYNVAIFKFKLSRNYHIQLSTFAEEKMKKIYESLQNINPLHGKCKGTFQIIISTSKQRQSRAQTNIAINNKS